MALLRLDRHQRFSCRQCARCCRRLEIVITKSERDVYLGAGAGAWFRWDEGAEAGTDREPFSPIAAHPEYYRIRKHPDGSCGFLGPDDRCRIHQELGGRAKPLTCQLFPFSFHSTGGATVVCCSFACPSVLASLGTSLADQERSLEKLRKEWMRRYPEPDLELLFAKGRRLSRHALDTLRQVLGRMLDRRGPEGRPSIVLGVRRMAGYLEDLTRWRVLRLEDHAFAEYLSLTGRHAAEADGEPRPRQPGRQGRRLGRGLVFAVLAARLQRRDGRDSGLRWGLRLRLFGLLAHVHGLAPPVGGFDARLARRAQVDLSNPEIAEQAHRYLRASIVTLGTGRRPVVDELAFAVALLNAGAALASVEAARAGRTSVAPAELAEGLAEACGLAHVEPGGTLGGFLGALSGGLEALRILSDGQGLWPPRPSRAAAATGRAVP